MLQKLLDKKETRDTANSITGFGGFDSPPLFQYNTNKIVCKEESVQSYQILHIAQNIFVNFC